MQIFIVGNGRTGTNWMGQIIGSHPDVAYGGEAMLKLVTSAIMLPDDPWKYEALEHVVSRYDLRIVQAAPKHYADKSHPALWMIDELAAAFPDAKFIAMKRDPVATVASMLNHSGVLQWHKLDHPSPFLGTTAENFDAYQKLEEFEKCAMRLKAHYDRIDMVRHGPLIERIVEARFEGFVEDDTQIGADWLFDWLGLPPHRIPPKLHARSDALTKWKDTLSDEQADRIRELMDDD